MNFYFLKSVTFLSFFHSILGQTYLRANGQNDTYSLVNSVFGGSATEVPDCAHISFGPHITQALDTTLNRPVFLFHVHVPQDNDRCLKFDRQRVEIKIYGPSPNYLKGFKGETVTLSWNFRINSHFQPSYSFTSLHQLKPKHGDDRMPIISLTPRYKSSGNLFELVYVNSAGIRTKPKIINLSDVAGKWIHACEQITYATNGKYSLTLTNLLTGTTIMSYSSNSIDMWRNGTSYVGPKWGIYRSLAHSTQLKNEQVKFDAFCLAKGNVNCT